MIQTYSRIDFKGVRSWGWQPISKTWGFWSRNRSDWTVVHCLWNTYICCSWSYCRKWVITRAIHLCLIEKSVVTFPKLLHYITNENIQWMMQVQFQVRIKDRCLGSRSHHLYSTLWISSFRQVRLSIFRGQVATNTYSGIMIHSVSEFKGNWLICSATGDQDELFDRIMAGTYEFIGPFWDDVSSSAKVAPYYCGTFLIFFMDSSFTLEFFSQGKLIPKTYTMYEKISPSWSLLTATLIIMQQNLLE